MNLIQPKKVYAKGDITKAKIHLEISNLKMEIAGVDAKIKIQQDYIDLLDIQINESDYISEELKAEVAEIVEKTNELQKQATKLQERITPKKQKKMRSLSDSPIKKFSMSPRDLTDIFHNPTELQQSTKWKVADPTTIDIYEDISAIGLYYKKGASTNATKLCDNSTSENYVGADTYDDLRLNEQINNIYSDIHMKQRDTHSENVSNEEKDFAGFSTATDFMKNTKKAAPTKFIFKKPTKR